MFKIEKIVSKGDYSYALVRGHPNANKHVYVLAHRVVMESYLGRPLLSSEVVHHINGDKKDNRIENLEVMTSGEHSRLHSTTGREMVDLICPTCGKAFSREKRNTHLINGRGVRTFCSRKCNGSYREG